MPLSLTLGCSDPDAQTPPTDLSVLVTGFADSLRSQQSFEQQFVAGAVATQPARDEYLKFGYLHASDSVTGDTATLEVEIKDRDDNILGTVEWTARKVGGEWKLESAPLL